MRNKIIEILARNNVSEGINGNREKAVDEIMKLFSSEKPKISQSDFEAILNHINTVLGKKYRGFNDAVKKKYAARLKEGFTIDDIKKAINNASKSRNHRENNYTYLTPEFFSRADKIEMWLNAGDGLLPDQKPTKDIAADF